MTWQEFRSLLTGLGPDTSLARTVQIRLEEDEEVLKNFTSSQHAIRNKWRSKRAKCVSNTDMDAVLSQFQEIFSSM